MCQYTKPCQSTKAEGTTKAKVNLDSRNLNKAIAREPNYYWIIDDIIPKLVGVKYITVMDMKSGYQQVPLDEKSSYITVFNTSWGHFPFTKVVFGMSVPGNVFQHKLDFV